MGPNFQNGPKTGEEDFGGKIWAASAPQLGTVTSQNGPYFRSENVPAKMVKNGLENVLPPLSFMQNVTIKTPM